MSVCETKFGSIEGTNEVVFKNKIKYDTLDIAIINAKKNNVRYGIGAPKVTAYKCAKCNKFHIGKNGNKITEKEYKKWLTELKSFR